MMRHLAAARTGDTDVEEELAAMIPAGARLWYATYLADQGRVGEVRAAWMEGEGGVPVLSPEKAARSRLHVSFSQCSSFVPS